MVIKSVIYLFIECLLHVNADENFVVECPPDADLDEEEEMTEIRFVPETESVLDDMYKAIQQCSLLHPDQSEERKLLLSQLTTLL